MRNDRGIRLELPYFLGAPKDWEGCYVPFNQSQVGLFQIGFKLEHGWKERAKNFFTQNAPRNLEGVDISTKNLLHYFEQPHREALQSCSETKKPGFVRFLSRCKKGCANLKAMVAGLDLELEGEGRKASDLKATVREIQEVPPNYYSSIDDALKQVAPRVCEDIARHTKGKQPGYLYVVIGTARVDLEATVKTQIAGQIHASVIGDGGGPAIGHQTEHVSITKNGIALMLLLKYETETLLVEHPKEAAVPSGNRGALHDSEDTSISWTVGERVPLDDDDTVNSALYTPAGAFAIDEISLKTMHDSTQEWSSLSADDDTIVEIEKPHRTPTCGRSRMIENGREKLEDIDTKLSFILDTLNLFNCKSMSRAGDKSLLQNSTATAEAQLSQISRQSELDLLRSSESKKEVYPWVSRSQTLKKHRCSEKIMKRRVAMDARLRGGMAVVVQNSVKKQKAGILRLATEYGEEGPVDVLELEQLSHTRLSYTKERIQCKDVAAFFCSTESDLSAAVVLLARVGATRQRENSCIRVIPFRFTVAVEKAGDDASSLRDDLLLFLQEIGDVSSGMLTNVFPTEEMKKVEHRISFFQDPINEDGLVRAASSCFPELLNISERLFKTGQLQSLAAPAVALFASIVAEYEGFHGLKLSFAGLLSRWSRIEGKLKEEEELRRHLLALAEDFFLRSRWRRYLTSVDFGQNVTRFAEKLDRAVQDHEFIVRAPTLKDVDNKLDLVLSTLRLFSRQNLSGDTVLLQNSAATAELKPIQSSRQTEFALPRSELVPKTSVVNEEVQPNVSADLNAVSSFGPCDTASSSLDNEGSLAHLRQADEYLLRFV